MRYREESWEDIRLTLSIVVAITTTRPSKANKSTTQLSQCLLLEYHKIVSLLVNRKKQKESMALEGLVSPSGLMIDVSQYSVHVTFPVARTSCCSVVWSTWSYIRLYMSSRIAAGHG